MERKVEFLASWPPPESSSSLEGNPWKAKAFFSSDTNSSEAPPSKRLKRQSEAQLSTGKLKLDQSSKFNHNASCEEELEQKLSADELHIVRCHHSVTVDALLARWWKMVALRESQMVLVQAAATEQIVQAKEEKVMSLIKANSGPQTQLYHISRYTIVYIVHVLASVHDQWWSKYTKVRWKTVLGNMCIIMILTDTYRICSVGHRSYMYYLFLGQSLCGYCLRVVTSQERRLFSSASSATSSFKFLYEACAQVL